MSKKSAVVFEWIGAGIIVLGAAVFAVLFVKKIQVAPIHYAVLLWALGVGILCYLPKSFVSYGEKKDDAENPGGEKAVRRSIALRFICALALIAYGFKAILA